MVSRRFFPHEGLRSCFVFPCSLFSMHLFYPHSLDHFLHINTSMCLCSIFAKSTDLFLCWKWRVDSNMAAVSDYLHRTLSAVFRSTTGDFPSNSLCESSRSVRTLPTPRSSYTCGDPVNEHALETEIRYIYHSLPNQKRHGKLTVTPNLHDALLQIQCSGLTGYL
jgi:hypothetical protein